MNRCLKLAPVARCPVAKPTVMAVTYTGEISGYDALSQSWLVDHDFSASCAVSLLVKPSIGDTVCFIEVEQHYYITALLSRQDSEAELLLESSQKVRWVAPELHFSAFDKLELTSLNKMVVMGKDTVVSAANAMIQQAENLIQQVGQYSLTAKGLLRLSGKHQVITAEKDVRIDGERINMG
ncbi:MAG: hypothetical protein ACI8WB_003318 [Phenylobacterium sp.]|jgi:hypothetical protein